MPSKAIDTTSFPLTEAKGWPSPLRLTYGALLVFAGYYAGARIGLALTFSPNPISVLWPPNAVLLAALLLAPTRMWPVLLIAALPAHLLAELEGGVPAPMVLCWFVSNVSEAMIGAICVRRLVQGPHAFDRVREVAVFIVGAVVLAPFLSSFLDAAFVTLNGWGRSDYADLWKTRFFSNALATLTLVPVIVTAATSGATALRNATPGRIVEAIALAGGLLAVGIMTFDLESSVAGTPPASLYLLLPFLLWAALRFGPAGATASFAAMAFLTIWGAAHGRGPFTAGAPEENGFAVQLFLTFVGVTVLAFAAFIRERTQLERVLRSSEERFSTAFHASPDAMAISRKSDGCFVEVNERWLELLGHRREDVVGHAVRDLNLLVDGSAREKLAALVDEQGDVHELELALRTAKGDVIHALIATRAVDMEGERRFVTIIRDHTERERAQAALRESEARFRMLADTAPVMIWMSGPDKGGTFFSKGWLDFAGRPLEQEVGDGWTKSVHPDDLERCLATYGDAFEARRRFEIEYRRRRHDGSYRWVLGAGVPRVAPDGTLLGYVGSCMDITDRRESEQMLRLALAVLPIGTLMVDETGTIALANAHVEKLFGYRHDELIGASVDMLMAERIVGDGYSAQRNGIFAMPQAQAMATGRDRHARRKDGSEFLVEIGLNPIQSHDGLLVLVAIVDVTDRYELQRSREELAHMTRISAMGELAASLAHELNQPLTAILSNVQAAQRFMTMEPIDLEEVRAILKDIVDDDCRASEVIRRMRALASKGQLEVVPLDLSAVIRDVAVLVQSDAIVRGVRLSMQIEPDLPVNGDRVQLQQVMLNLLLNAFDAMKDCPTGERAVLVCVERVDGGLIRVAVSDRGTGLSGDKLDKIFTPFFTSKRDGLGLGLSISRSIIEAHRGRLRAANNPDRGATFHFMLPERAPAH